MKLKDAKPGQVLRDNDGDTWKRHEHGATVHFTGPRSNNDARPVHHDEWALDQAEVCFGPFAPVEP